jgi:hypothetical protein
MRNKKIIFIAAAIALLLIVSGCNQFNDTDADMPVTETIITGGTYEILDGTDAGFALEKFPQIKSMSIKDFMALEEIPETGLFLVDTNYVPFDLDAQLEESGVMLNPDGTLVNEDGELATLFIRNEVMKVLADDGASKGTPYVFDNYSWSMRWKYDGGFCRDYYSYTDAYAWGPELGGGRPRTRIEYIYTYASIGSITDSDHCYTCDEEHSRAHWDVGCGWPAHVKPCGYQYAYWRDGSLTGVHSWSWCS